jgi:hypothetical protein
MVGPQIQAMMTARDMDDNPEFKKEEDRRLCSGSTLGLYMVRSDLFFAADRAFWGTELR